MESQTSSHAKINSHEEKTVNLKNGRNQSGVGLTYIMLSAVLQITSPLLCMQPLPTHGMMLWIARLLKAK